MPSTDRRTFVKTTAAVAAAGSIAPFAIGAPRGRRALDMINIGVVGTGGRGTGACNDSLTINPNVRIVAMGNLHADRAKNRRNQLKEAHGDRVDVRTTACTADSKRSRKSSTTPTSTWSC